MRGLHAAFFCGRVNYCVHGGKWGWPLVWLVVRPYLMWWLQACWRVRPGPHVASCVGWEAVVEILLISFILCVDISCTHYFIL